MTPSVDQVIRDVDHMRLRTGMYVGDVNVASVDHFLTGVLNGLRIAGWPISRGAYRRITKERGWESRHEEPISLMRKHGLSDEQIIEELFVIHKEVICQSFLEVQSRAAAK